MNTTFLQRLGCVITYVTSLLITSIAIGGLSAFVLDETIGDPYYYGKNYQYPTVVHYKGSLYGRCEDSKLLLYDDTSSTKPLLSKYDYEISKYPCSMNDGKFLDQAFQNIFKIGDNENTVDDVKTFIWSYVKVTFNWGILIPLGFYILYLIFMIPVANVRWFIFGKKWKI